MPTITTMTYQRVFEQLLDSQTPLATIFAPLKGTAGTTISEGIDACITEHFEVDQNLPLRTLVAQNRLTLDQYERLRISSVILLGNGAFDPQSIESAKSYLRSLDEHPSTANA